IKVERVPSNAITTIEADITDQNSANVYEDEDEKGTFIVEGISGSTTPVTITFEAGNVTTTVSLTVTGLSYKLEGLEVDDGGSTRKARNVPISKARNVSKLKSTREEEGEDDPITLTLTGIGTLTTLTNLVVPDELHGFPVTAIAKEAFYNHRKLTSATIGKNINTIGESAFKEDIKDVVTLTTLAFKKGSTNDLTIEKNAFKGTKIVELEIPSRTTIIGEFAFATNEFSGDLTTLTFEAGGTKDLNIKEYAFGEHAIKVLAIPNRVTKIGTRAFYASGSSRGTLTKLTFEVGDDKDLAIGEQAFLNQKIVELEIPKRTTEIGNDAFAVLNDSGTLTTLTFEAGGTKELTIGNNAFKYQKLTEVKIPSRTTVIGLQAFENNANLKDVYIDSQTIANLTDNNSELFSAAQTVYVKSGITPSSASYIIKNFPDKGSAVGGYVPYGKPAIITLTKGSTTIVVGGTEQIKQDVVPESALSRVRWETENKSIVDVDPISGLMTGISDGVATVTAKIPGTNTMASCVVTVFGWANRDGAFVTTGKSYEIVINEDGKAKDKNGSLVNVETLHYKFPSGDIGKTFYIESNSKVERNVFISFENTTVKENNDWASGLRIYGKGTKKLTVHIRLTGTNFIVAGKGAGPWHGIHLEEGNKDVDIIFYANGKSSLSMKGNSSKRAVGVAVSTSSITLKGASQTKITSTAIPTFPRKVTTTQTISEREIVINVEE
ncbi:MAG: leucine-rich repeat protein, partial [Treponemataceae bacterium]